MSGTFMDGGGNDQGGHGSHGGGGGGFGDGGHDHGHDHGSHGHDSFHEGGHDGGQHGHLGHGHGGEGGGLSLSSLLGLNDQQHHSFLAHLLGLDHDAHAGHGAAHAVSSGSAIPFWSVALQGVTVSSLFQGMRISPAGWMLILFFIYIGWLFLIYWLRHHEPQANAALGTQIVGYTNHSLAKGSVSGDHGVSRRIASAPMPMTVPAGTVVVPSAALPMPISSAPPSLVAPAAFGPLTPAPITVKPAVSLMPAGFRPAPGAATASPLESSNSVSNRTSSAFLNPSDNYNNGSSPAITVPVYDMSGPGARVKTIIDR